MIKRRPWEIESECGQGQGLLNQIKNSYLYPKSPRLRLEWPIILDENFTAGRRNV